MRKFHRALRRWFQGFRVPRAVAGELITSGRSGIPPGALGSKFQSSNEGTAGWNGSKLKDGGRSLNHRTLIPHFSLAHTQNYSRLGTAIAGKSLKTFRKSVLLGKTITQAVKKMIRQSVQNERCR